MSGTLHYRVRFRDAYDTTDVLVVTSLPGDENPYLVSPPEGDGTSVDPLEGHVGVGAYLIEIADEVGVLHTPTLLFDEQWLYADVTARDAVWIKETSQAAAYTSPLKDFGTGDYGGILGQAKGVAVTYGGGVGGGGGYAKHTVTVTGLTPSETYTVVCDSMAMDRAAAGGLDDFGMAINSGAGNRPANGALEGPVIASGTANGSGELTISLGHFDLEYGMTGIAMEFGRIRIFGPSADIVTRVVTGWLSDEEARWQTLGVHAFVEESTDEGQNWTVLLGAFVESVTLAGGIKYVVRISESDRRERRSQMFEREEGPFYATPIIGAPVGFGPLPDSPYDWWEFTVEDTGDSNSDLPGDAVVLDFVRGWMYEHRSGPSGPSLLYNTGFEGLIEKFDEISNETRTMVNARAPQYAETVNGAVIFTGITAAIRDTSGNYVANVNPYGWWDRGLSAGLYKAVGISDDLIVRDQRIAVQWVGTLPSVGTTYRVTATPVRIGESNPLHYEGHPVDLARAMYDVRAIAYDAASAEAVKDALGPIRVRYRWTAGETLQDALEQSCFGPFGFAVRPTETGEWEFFLTRGVPADQPATTVTNDDVYDPDAVVFDHHLDSMVNRIRWDRTLWAVWHEGIEGDPPADGVIGTVVPVTVEAEDSTLVDVGVREQVYTLPGDVLVYNTGPAVDGKFATDQWFIGQGADILRRWSRGCPSATLNALRGLADADVGAFLIVTMAHKPNPATGRVPTSQRGGARIAQVVHRTVTPAGPVLEVLDYGPTTDAGALVPTFTLAQGADTRHVATYTITNDGALTGFDVRIEMATGASEPTGNGVLVSVGAADGDPHDLPGVNAGATVWVRMRAEPEGGGIPGDWSAWQSVALDALPPVTGLANAAGANDTERLITWAVGDADLRVRVRWGLTSEGTYTSSVTLPPGSTQYVITGLTPGVGYTAAVDHLDDAPYTGDSADATTSWTSGSTVPVLNPPTNPAGISDGAGTYGMEVTAYQTELPSRVSVEVAVETAAGAGTFGAYAVLGSTESVAGGRTRVTGFAPNDGLLRRLRAQHTKSGYTASAYTSEVDVDPWAVAAPPSERVEESTDSVMLWAAGVGVAGVELVDVKNGKLALQYSLDSGASWDFFDAAVADQGPYVTLTSTGPLKGAWLAPDAAAQDEILIRTVKVTDAGTVTAYETAQTLWKYCGGVKRLRVGAYVVTAGGVSVDPIVRNIWVETSAFGDVVAPPPVDPPPGEVVSSCSALDTYPIARGLLAWHLADCGTFDTVASPEEVKTLTDLSGNGWTLNPTADEAISGAVVTRGLTASAVTIPTLNGRQPISFQDAWLPWDTTLFTGIIEAELFLVVRGFQTDPTNDRFYCWTLGTNTGPTNQPYWAQGTGATGTGIIKEDFGSSTLRDLGDAPGNLQTGFRIYNVRAAAGLFAAALDGTDFFSSGTNTVGFSTAPKMGSRSENSQILIAEIAIHSLVLTSDERASVVAALQARWAL